MDKCSMMVRMRALAFAGALASAGSAGAAILSQHEVAIVLLPGKVPAGTIWSEGLKLTGEGLARAGAGGDANAWVQTHAIPVGLAWRPPQSARLAITALGRADKRSRITVQLRHGIDAVHWSPWQALQVTRPGDKDVLCSATAELRAPGHARKAYEGLRREWLKSDPNWKCNEEELCYWIARTQPAFFRTERPFLGYVQARLEAPLAKGDRLCRLRVRIAWGVGGLASMPKRGKPDERKCWSFDLRRTSPGAAWKALLDAMRAGDEAAMARFATPAGLRSITVPAIGPRRPAAKLKSLARVWSRFNVRWGKWDKTEAHAAMGPEVKEHGLTFTFTPEGWKLAEWRPGK